MKFELDPKTVQYICATFALIGLLATASPSMFPSYLPAGVVADVIQTAGFLTFLWNGFNAITHGFSSSRPGPWAPQDPPVVVEAQKVADLPPTAGPVLIADTKAAATQAVLNHQP